jgi:hypothetical protein
MRKTHQSTPPAWAGIDQFSANERSNRKALVSDKADIQVLHDLIDALDGEKVIKSRLMSPREAAIKNKALAGSRIGWRKRFQP